MSKYKSDNATGESSTHESFGVISFGHVACGGGKPLFGSSLRHSNFVSLRISRAQLNRSLNYDRFMATETIVELDLSPVQFAEVITSMNRGDGIPCTLRRVNGKGMAEPPYTHKQEQFSKEFREDTKEVAARVDEALKFARELQEKPSATKGDRASLVKMLEMLRQAIGSNLPFVLDQFHEQMNKSVHEAKGEIEAFVQHRIVEAGLAAIHSAPTPTILEVEQSKDPI